MSSKVQEYNSTFRWTAPKKLFTIITFFMLSLISEFVIVSFFAGSGLIKVTSYLPVSPLFHLLPLAVIVVLVFSWMNLTKHVVMKRYRKTPFKVSKTPRRQSRRRIESKGGLIKAVKNFFSKITAIFLHSSNVSVMPRKLTFRRAAIESTVTILTIFLLSIILLSILAYPRLFSDFAVEFYSTTSPIQSLMQSLANTLVPIASGLNSIAPSFSKIFDGLVVIQSLAGEDLLVRYVFCQIAATLISVVSVLVYVRFSKKA